MPDTHARRLGFLSILSGVVSIAFLRLGLGISGPPAGPGNGPTTLPAVARAQAARASGAQVRRWSCRSPETRLSRRRSALWKTAAGRCSQPIPGRPDRDHRR